MKGYYAIGIVIAVVVIGAAAYALTQGSAQAAPSKTFYVVAYHWGFAAFDESGKELDKINVRKGTSVTLKAANHEAIAEGLVTMPAGVDSAIKAVDFEMKEASSPVPAPEGKTVMDLVEETEAQGLIEHSLGITEYNVNIALKEDATNLSSVTFTADKTGSFDFVCTIGCGVGHVYMAIEKLVVT